MTESGSEGGALAVARKHTAPIVLVLASLATAIGGLFDDPAWVAVIAAVVAIYAGWKTVTAEVVLPWRRGRLAASVVRTAARTDTGFMETAQGFSIGSGLWVVPDYAARSSKSADPFRPVFLRVKKAWVPAEVVHRDGGGQSGLMIVRTFDSRHPAVQLEGAPEEGDVIVAATVSPHRGPNGVGIGQLLVEYRCIGGGTAPNRDPAEDSRSFAYLSGPAPSKGWGGSPLMNARTGRVCGVLIEKATKEEAPISAYAAHLDEVRQVLPSLRR